MKTYYSTEKFKIEKISDDEVFKDISEFSGNLKISNYGRVWENEKIVFSGMNYNIKKVIPARILRQSDNLSGYLYITVTTNGKTFRRYVHRLVATYFCENPDNKTFVNHKDENPRNNNYTNLEWVKAKENSNWGTCRKRISLSRKRLVGVLSSKYRGKEYYKTKKISRNNFRKICKKNNWDINDFEEVFSGEIYAKNKDKLYYYITKN